MENFEEKKTLPEQVVVIPSGQAGAIEPVTVGTTELAPELAPLPGKTGAAWGWFPALSLVCAVGIMLSSLAMTGARNNAGWAQPLYWLALLIMFVPVAVRFTAKDLARREAIGLATVLGVGLYFVKVMHSPTEFTFHDEFVHMRTTLDIVTTHHLFSINPNIPVSPLYPGLHIVTSAIMNLSGMDVFSAGLLVIGLARLLLILSLYLFFEEISRSPRVAGIACLVYMGNSNFVYFSSQYAYESLALPLVLFTMWVIVKRSRSAVPGTRIGMNMMVVLGMGAAIVTHHLTAYAIITFLALWTLTAFAMGIVRKLRRQEPGESRWRGIYRASVGQMAILWRQPKLTTPTGGEWDYPAAGGALLLALVASFSWLVYVATLTVGYLAPVLSGAFIEIIQIILGESRGRQLFQGSTGQVAPLWEQLTGYGAVACILAGLPWGVWRAWRGHRRDTLVMTMAVASLVYPASLGFRLTTSGWEVSNRTSEFIFVIVGLVLALGIVEFWWKRPRARLWKAVFVGYVTLIFLGGLMIGWPPYARMPGSYMVEADTRSIEPQGVSDAQWAKTYLGPNNRMTADRVNALLMLGIGQQRMVMGSDKVQIGWFYLANNIGDDQIGLLRKGQVRYMVVDRRMSQGLPAVGIYFEAGEPDSNRHTTPVNPALLDRFDHLPGAYRVFDSGDIQIYDVQGVWNATP